MEEILTHEMIRKIDKEEQLSQKLTRLPGDFAEKVKNYIKAKSELLEQKTGSMTEFQNTKGIIQGIMERRERKIMMLALSSVRTGIPPENLLDFEKEFFDKIVAELRNLKHVRDGLLEPSKDELGKVVAFIDNVDAFAGEDSKNYGPYKIGDIATIPSKYAELLLKAGKIDEIKAK